MIFYHGGHVERCLLWNGDSVQVVHCRWMLFVLACSVVALAPGVSVPEDLWGCERHVIARQVMMAERTTRGRSGISCTQPIDSAAWIAHPDVKNKGFSRFRCPFVLNEHSKIVVDVSADERFVLFVDGREIGRGPHKGMPEHWFYTTYEIDIPAGRHFMEAVTWRLDLGAPVSQLSYREGFILKARDGYDGILTTGIGPWKVARLTSTSMEENFYAWGGSPCVSRGTSFADERPNEEEFENPRIVREKLRDCVGSGKRPQGWILFPAVLPDQLHREVRPGAFRASRDDSDRSLPYVSNDANSDMCAKMNALLRKGERVVFPPRTKMRLLWDLGDYYCAWPHLELSRGKGARFEWYWYESLVGTEGKKGDRSAFIGKKAPCEQRGRSIALADGREMAVFETPWWRCGRWCEFVIETLDEPLDVVDVKLFETRYPTEPEESFTCDDPTIEGVKRICVRGMQECMHGMFFDCPYYEQQMYPGDTRVEMLTAAVLNADDRLVKHGIALYDYARRDDGMLPMNWPTRCLQESATYTLCWPMMLADYAKWRGDVVWLKARLPGLRQTMSAFEQYEDDEGLIKGLPGWCFADWTPAWCGVAPDGGSESFPSAFNNLFYLAALRCAENVEAACGSGLDGFWRTKAEKTAAAIRARFWCEEKCLVADDVKKSMFSEHAQCLALLYDALPEGNRGKCFAALIGTPGLATTTVYFSHYLFETYFRFGRPDLFLKRLDLWRNYVKIGLKTPLESPGDAARSDCHAWGSHPLFHFHAGLAGVRPDGPFFRAVRIAPQPGPLKFIRAKTPTPSGLIVTELDFCDGRARGRIVLPGTLTGRFVWKGEEREMKSGVNEL